MTLYSHSRISCFESCPFKYKLKYIDKVRPEIEQTIEAFMGSIVHKTMEKLYRDLRYFKMSTLPELLQFYNEEWRKSWNKAILLVRRDYTPENYRQMGEGFVRTYYETHHPFNQAKTVGLEQRILIDLADNGKFMLQGYMDRLACTDDNTYEIHDYKTNSTLPLKQYLEEDRQLALYAMAVKKSYQTQGRTSSSGISCRSTRTSYCRKRTSSSRSSGARRSSQSRGSSPSGISRLRSLSFADGASSRACARSGRTSPRQRRFP